MDGKITVRTVNNGNHYKNLKKHILRESKKYENIKYFLHIFYVNDTRFKYDSNTYHFCFEFSYNTNSEFQEAVELYAKIAADLNEKALVASVVGGENIENNGSIFEMYHTLHVIYYDPQAHDIYELFDRLNTEVFSNAQYLENIDVCIYDS